MKAYKLEVLVIVGDEIGGDEIASAIENALYPNRCIYPIVERVVGRDIGEWDDDHPLNLNATHEAEYQRIFGDDLTAALARAEKAEADAAALRRGYDIVATTNADDLPTHLSPEAFACIDDWIAWLTGGLALADEPEEVAP